jgi:hypothetical protein
MAKIKSYTDLEQSKKLAEILPLESADMEWINGDGLGEPFPFVGRTNDDEGLPCWSLVALFNALPIFDNRSPVLSKTFDRKYKVVYAVYHSTAYEKVVYTENFDNPIDACVAMIECLHELNLL